MVPSNVTVVPPFVEIDEGKAELIKLVPCSSEKDAARPVKTYTDVLENRESKDGQVLRYMK